MHTYILIPVYNNASITFDCLRSLQAVKTPQFSVIIGDNGSTEDDFRKLQEFAAAEKFPFPYTFLRNDMNKGFGAINNAMVRRIREEDSYVLFLNNDTVVEKTCLLALTTAFESDGNCGGVCPLICLYDDPERIWFGGGRVSLRKRSVFTHHAIDLPRKSFSPAVRRADFLTGCALFTTKRIFESAGGFDERIFLYCEDVDWSLRIIKTGRSLLVTGATTVLHKVSRSTEKLGADFTTYMLTSSTLYCCLKHFSFAGKILVMLKIIRKVAGFSLKVFTPSKYASMQSYTRGVAHGFRLFLAWRSNPAGRELRA